MCADDPFACKVHNPDPTMLRPPNRRIALLKGSARPRPTPPRPWHYGASIYPGNQPLASKTGVPTPLRPVRASAFSAQRSVETASSQGRDVFHNVPDRSLRVLVPWWFNFLSQNTCGEKNLSGTRRYQAVPAGTKRYDPLSSPSPERPRLEGARPDGVVNRQDPVERSQPRFMITLGS